MKTSPGKIIIRTAGILLLWLSLIYLYTLLHEGGHALVAIMYGGRIDSFVLGFNAYVSQSGANFTPLGESLFNIAGVLLPAICLAVALKFYNRNVVNPIYHYIYGTITIAVIGSFLASVVIPLISLFTEPPVDDDISKFLQVSGLNPLLVSFTAIMIILLFLLFSYKIGLYSKIIEYLKPLSKTKRDGLNKQQTAVLVLVIIFLGAVVFVSYQILVPNKVFETSFSTNIRDNQEVMRMPFIIKTGKSYKMSLNLEAEGILTDIQIYDDNGNIVYQNICEQFSLSTTLKLKPGNYLLELTFIRDPDVMVKYFGEKKYAFSQDQVNMLKELFEKTRNDELIPVSFSAIIQ
ncbi:MAG TPA: hypothetical protein GXX20_10910 [Clostridiaceae bacterium]|nr:hypothetical protein [Clostridiaceae bacterium]